ncbi:hypothetical protein GEMRC1_004977 [Eukaryota sp. GEM-RC1]
MSAYSSEERDTAHRLISDLGLSQNLSSYIDEATYLSPSSSSPLSSPSYFSPHSNLGHHTQSDVSLQIKRAVSIAKKSSELKISKMAERIAELEHELVMTRLQRSKPSLESKRASEEVSRNQSLSSDISKLNAEVNSLHRELDNQKSLNSKLSEQLDAAKSSHRSTYDTQFLELNTRNQSLSSDISKLNAEVNSLHRELDNQKSLNSKLSEQLDAAKSSHRSTYDTQFLELNTKNQSLSLDVSET